ncbi:MAG TPA: DUF885 family protein, partial [Terriglobales bacterium]|nr:DUF885 family protein [Terriglobales bacterium]
MRRIAVLAVLVFAFNFRALAQASSSDFDKLVDETFDSIYKFSPSGATADGFHQYDTQLENLSKASVAAETEACKNSLAKLQAFPRTGLSESSSADLDFLIARMQSRLLELETIQMWRRDPDIYTSTATNSIFLLMSRKFASEDERLRSVVAREKLIPGMLQEARKNLSDVPRVYTQVAIEDLANTPGFFKNDVPKAFTNVKDAKLLAEFRVSNANVIAAFKQYETFLKDQLLPASKGDFRL